MKNIEERLTKKTKRREAKKRIRPKISGRTVFQIQAIKKRGGL